MKWLQIGYSSLALLSAIGSVRADEKWAELKVGSQVYSNVTVTSVTVTDLYFNYPGGMGNAKLKDLSPELQKHYRYNAARAEEAIKKQLMSNALYREEFRARAAKAAAEMSADRVQAIYNEEGDLVASKLYAKSVRGERPPQIFIDEWLTPPPDVEGKFALILFWATWAGPSRDAIPPLNVLQEKFKDRLVIIALSDEPLDAMRKLTSPRVGFTSGTDQQARTRNALEVQGLPHSILIDPKGIVRFEGLPSLLDESGVQRLLDKYGN
jgi:cytochrome c biogenesis protein CcmG, thiol:disulfide interchange protein DsbE